MTQPYTLTWDTGIVFKRPGTKIPLPDGPDERCHPLASEYQAWLAAGNVPDPPDPAEAPPVPSEVSAAQGRLALLQVGVLDALEAWIATQPRATQIEYAARSTWRRDWPLVATGGAAMGLSEVQMDDLFKLAATL